MFKRWFRVLFKYRQKSIRKSKETEETRSDSAVATHSRSTGQKIHNEDGTATHMTIATSFSEMECIGCVSSSNNVLFALLPVVLADISVNDITELCSFTNSGKKKWPYVWPLEI